MANLYGTCNVADVQKACRVVSCFDVNHSAQMVIIEQVDVR